MAISITDNGEGLLSFLGECEERLREHILSAINQALKQAKETHEAAEEKSTGESYTQVMSCVILVKIKSENLARTQL